MDKNTNGLIKNQQLADDLAESLSKILGANVVKKSDYDAINKEKQILLKRTKDYDVLQLELLKAQCKLHSFIRYHAQWKPKTKIFEKRLFKLHKEKVYIDFTDYPRDIADNLKEAYNCYINGVCMASYIMVLRTIEIAVTLIYDQHNPAEENDFGRRTFVPAIKKLNWIKSRKMIGGADFTVAKAFIEARNDSVHEVFVPTDKQIMSAFETVIKLVEHLKINIKE